MGLRPGEIGRFQDRLINADYAHMALDCVQRYEQIMGVCPRASVVAARGNLAAERGVMGYASAKEVAALANE